MIRVWTGTCARRAMSPACRQERVDRRAHRAGAFREEQQLTAVVQIRAGRLDHGERLTLGM